MLANRRLVLKQLPGGQFALTVLGGSFVIANSHAVDTGTGSTTVGSSCEADVSDSHVCHVSCLVHVVTISIARSALLALQTCNPWASGPPPFIL